MAERVYLTVAEVASILMVHEDTVRRWCREGACPHFRFQGIIRIPITWVGIKRSGKAIMDNPRKNP